jgi:hypothetical protein
MQELEEQQKNGPIELPSVPQTNPIEETPSKEEPEQETARVRVPVAA